MSIKKSIEKYPCLGSSRKQNPKKNKLCKVCSKRADRIVEIQWWWSRGDDTVEAYCDEHCPKNKEDILRLTPTEEI